MRSNQQFLMWSAKWLMLLVCIACLALGNDGRGPIGKVETSRGGSRAKAPSPARLAENYGKIPLSFEANQGQTDARVKFLSRGPGYTLFLTGDGVALELQGSGVRSQKSGVRIQDSVRGRLPRSLSLLPQLKDTGPLETDHGRRNTDNGRSSVLRLKLLGANQNAAVTGTSELPGKANYFLGNDPHKWRTNVPTYARAKYKDVYQGVDLVYYGSQNGRLEYDFVVAPGADPSAIGLAVGAGLVPAQGRPQGSPLRIAADGDLVIPTEGGEVHFQRPLIYQEGSGGRREIPGGYVLKGAREVAFKVGAYDPTRPLVIDPVLVYSTYLGGSTYDLGEGIAVDSSGNAYVTGYTESADFPTTAGAFQTSLAGAVNAFVTKLNPTGSALVYSSYLGGSSGSVGYGIAVDSSGHAYVTGQTYSGNFPTTAGAFQTSLAGTLNAFVTKLNLSGSALLYSTYLGGSSYDYGFGIAVDSSGHAYVTGQTYSGNFPTTAGAFQTSLAGTLSAFVTKVNPDGSALAYSTYLGGNSYDGGGGIAVDSSGNAYVTGSTRSANFPTTAGAFQTSLAGTLNAFVTKLNPGGFVLVYSTYLGGSTYDWGQGIAVDSVGNAYVSGSTQSDNFPTTAGAFQTSLVGGQNAFVAKLGITPQAQVANLENSVKAIVAAGTLNRGTGQLLLAPLNTALADLARGRTGAAIRELNAFTFWVRFLVFFHRLTPAEGTTLIDAATSIITALRV